jgi:RNA polymerase sigma-70 factor, ECF subfamily
VAISCCLVPDALRRGRGPYPIEAAIAALHAQAPRATDTDWPQIAALFDELCRRKPTSIVELNRAVAIAMAHGAADGLAAIEPLRTELADYHLLHAARADLLRRLGRRDDAAAAYRDAIARAGSEPERRFLARRLAELE